MKVHWFIGVKDVETRVIVLEAHISNTCRL